MKSFINFSVALVIAYIVPQSGLADTIQANALFAAGLYEEAFHLYKPLADAGNAEAMYYVCTYYDQGVVVKKNLKISFRYCEQAAEKGFPRAIAHVGYKYRFGMGVAQDKQRAAVLFEEASEMKVTEAMINLSTMYFKGEGIEKDIKKAFEYSMAAAELGSPVGAYNIGSFYLQGLEPEAEPADPINVESALQWYKKAAKMGYPNALAALGYIYMQQDLGYLDYEEAFFWLSLASIAGVENVNSLKFKAELSLSQGARQRVSQRLKEWRPEGINGGR